jgi:hypothetical protein
MKISVIFCLRCALLTALLFMAQACYRMPGEDEYSVVPTTNNPSVIQDKTDTFLPGMGGVGY